MKLKQWCISVICIRMTCIQFLSHTCLHPQGGDVLDPKPHGPSPQWCAGPGHTYKSCATTCDATTPSTEMCCCTANASETCGGVGILDLFDVSDMTYTQVPIQDPYCDSSLTFEARVDDLLQRMTQEEKLACMTSNTCTLPRLGLATDWAEALHGLRYACGTDVKGKVQIAHREKCFRSIPLAKPVTHMLVALRWKLHHGSTYWAFMIHSVCGTLTRISVGTVLVVQVSWYLYECTLDCFVQFHSCCSRQKHIHNVSIERTFVQDKLELHFVPHHFRMHNCWQHHSTGACGRRWVAVSLIPVVLHVHGRV